MKTQKASSEFFVLIKNILWPKNENINNYNSTDAFLTMVHLAICEEQNIICVNKR